MLKKKSTIIFFIVLAIISALVYQNVKIPDGVTPQSESQLETIAWLSLWTAIISLITSIVGLIQNILERKNHEE